MKTTIDLDDDLLEAAERFAATRGSTLQAVVERALRAYLDRPARHVAEEFKLRRHLVRGRGLRPELAGASWAEILEVSCERSPRSLPRN